MKPSAFLVVALVILWGLKTNRFQRVINAIAN